MMNSSDFKKIAKKIIKRQRGLRDIQIMHPAREWHLGMLVALLLVLGSVILSASTYYKNKQTDITAVSTSEVETVVYRETMVEAALENLAERDSVRKALISESVPVIEILETINASTTDLAEVASSTEAAPDVSVESASTTETNTEQQ